MNINQHVVKRERGWAVVGEGNQRDTIVLPSQQAAIERARKIALNKGSNLIIHLSNAELRRRTCTGCHSMQLSNRP